MATPTYTECHINTLLRILDSLSANPPQGNPPQSNPPQSNPPQGNDGSTQTPSSRSNDRSATFLVGDMVFRQLSQDIRDDEKHNKALFLLQFCVGTMAVRFDLVDLARWAWRSIGTLLRSAKKLATDKWGILWLTRMLVYYEAILESEPNVARELLAFFRLVLSMSLDNRLIETQEEPATSLEACVTLYKSSSLLGSPMSNFARGYTFIALLSLGHNSAVWKSQLTSDDRSILYAAQVHLVSLGEYPFLELGWIQIPTRFGIADQACFNCSHDFTLAWSESFGLLGTLNSPVQLVDVSKLARLPQCRYLFAERFRTSEWPCKLGCGGKMIKKVDEYLDRIFNEQSVILYREFAE
ncbi:hypothetical protein FRC07_004084 [Ceratobasidium sp. 392]|nr:hypothetical protein FRC07_004084 [Ceratobasidium sp. 392]